MKLETQPARSYSSLITRGRNFPTVTKWWQNVSRTWTFEKAWSEWEDGESALWSVILTGVSGVHLVMISSYMLRQIEHTWEDPYMSMFVQALEERTNTDLSNFQVNKLKGIIRLIDDDHLRHLAALARFSIKRPAALMTLLYEISNRSAVNRKELAKVIKKSVTARNMANLLSKPLKKNPILQGKVIHLSRLK